MINKLVSIAVNVPNTLKKLGTWCGYYNNESGKLDKKPISIKTKRGGVKVTDPTGLVEFDEAEKTLKSGKIAAIGVGLTPESGVICIDIDCHDPNLQDKYEELKDELLQRFEGYAETSVSGLGAHIFIKGTIPEGYKNRDKYGIIEVFNNRFLVVTGDLIDGRTTDVLEQQSAIDWLFETYIPKNSIERFSSISISKSERTDEQIVEKAIQFDKGKKFFDGCFEEIFKRDKSSGEMIKAYPSKSEADLGFCNLLLYVNGNDIEQATRIFLGSKMAVGLERKSSGYLYTQMSVASLSLFKIYDWGSGTNSEALEKCIEINEIEDALRLESLVERIRTEGFCITCNDKLNDFAAKYVQNFGLAAKDVLDTSLGDYDSIGNGRRFFYLMNDKLIYNPTSNEWALWTGKKWSRCYDEDLLGETEKIFNNLKHEAFIITLQSAYETDEEKRKKLEKQAEELFRYASTSKNKRNCSEMISFSKSYFDQNEYLKLEAPMNAINLHNGIFDFERMELIKHDKSYYQTKISNVMYDETAVCPIWEKTLKRIVPNEDIRDYLQKAVGYTICSHFNEKALFILHGEGNNGKTTFINVLLKIMGEYSVVVAPATIMENAANKNNGPRPDLLKLRDRRFCAVSESNENDKLSEGIIKSLTGAGYISCRTLHKEPVEFRATFKLWFDTNHRPTVRGTDLAIWSRLKILPFEESIGKDEIDTKLGEKLEAELPGILNWCIEGYKQYRANGLIEPDIIKICVQQFSDEQSGLDQWFKECIEIKTDETEIKKTSTNSKELYQSYKNWSIANGEYIWSQRKFTTELNKKAPCKFTKTVNGIVRYTMIKFSAIGQLCFSKDRFTSADFSMQYSELVNQMFRSVDRMEKCISEYELKLDEKRSAQVIPIKHTLPNDKLKFGG